MTDPAHESPPVADSAAERDYDAEVWVDIGMELEKARKQQRLSKRKAADAIGVSEASWRMYENGGRKIYGTWVIPNPDEGTLQRIADTFGVAIVNNGPDEEFSAWEYTLVEPKAPVPEGAAAASGDPSHLTGIMSDLAGAVRELRDEVRLLRQRGEESDVEPMDGSEP